MCPRLMIISLGSCAGVHRRSSGVVRVSEGDERENAAIYGERKSDAGGGETCATKALGEKADLDLYLPDLWW